MIGARPLPPQKLTYLLLTLAALFWSGNFVLARMTHADIPPLGLSFWRWLTAAAIAAPLFLPHLGRQWPLIRANWRLLAILSAFGVAGFNSFLYLGLQDTSAIHAVLIGSVVPLEILLIAWWLEGQRASRAQLIAVTVSLAGVAVIVIGKHVFVDSDYEVNTGDLWVLAAGLSWAFYSVLLRRRPAALHSMSLLGSTILIGMGFIAPFWLFEQTAIRAIEVNQTTLAMIGYVAVFPSVLAYLFWNRGIADIGAPRTGQFVHLMPLFGTGLAVFLLDEMPGWNDLTGGALILIGILLANRRD